MTLTANWSYPTAIRFGAGRVAELPGACAEAGIQRPLFVTDRGLASLPMTQAALDVLEAGELGRAVFPRGRRQPNREEPRFRSRRLSRGRS